MDRIEITQKQHTSQKDVKENGEATNTWMWHKFADFEPNKRRAVRGINTHITLI